MTITHDPRSPGAAGASMAEETRIAVLYRDLGGVLSALMRGRFGIPEEDAENLLHDIFTSLIRCGAVVEDAEKWLIGAACNASRFYWRKQREESAVPDQLWVESGAEQEVALDQILDRLPERAREVLRLKYLEGLSGNEIAERYGTSPEYAHVLIHRSLEKARALAREDTR